MKDCHSWNKRKDFYLQPYDSEEITLSIPMLIYFYRLYFRKIYKIKTVAKYFYLWPYNSQEITLSVNIFFHRAIF